MATGFPLSAVNQAAGRELVEVPSELASLVERGMKWGDLSEGAFDITWLEMGNLWQFDESFRVSDSKAVEEARSRVNYRAIRIEGNRLGLPGPGMAIGLGGIAKGYAVDRVSGTLRQAGINDFLVDGGGDLFASGSRLDKPWRLGIRDPRGNRDELVAVLHGFQGALVTSGDYERSRIVEGVRYHHIIDPRTGRPAQGCRSVTVAAPTAEAADVLATAIFVLGPARGLKLTSVEPGSEVLIIDNRGEYWMTEGFQNIAEFVNH